MTIRLNTSFASLLALPALLLGLTPLGCSDGGQAAQGYETGACFPDATCNDGLVCRSSLCVSPDATTETCTVDCAAGSGGTGNTGTGGAPQVSPGSGGGTSTSGGWCDFVVPGATCLEGRQYVMQASGSDYVEVSATEMEATMSGEFVSLRWFLEPSQRGVVEYRLSEPFDPYDLELTTLNGEFATASLETSDGLGGCSYTFDSFGMYRNITLDNNGNVAWWGCWGTLDATTEYEPTNLTVIKLQTLQVSEPTQVKIDLYEVFVR